MRPSFALWTVVTLLVLTSASTDADDEDAACPPDSVLDASGQCVCAPERCHAAPPCRAGFDASLRRRASNKPGDCCDVVECAQPPERDCTNVTCTPHPPCPEDSYHLPGVRAPNACCAVAAGCACFPPPCAAAACAEGEFARQVRAGRGTPGQCCPLYRCLPYADFDNATCAADDGATWRRDACTECSCVAGVVSCSASPHCEPLPPGCASSSVPADGCCPQCDDPSVVSTALTDTGAGGCMTSRGELLPHGAIWAEDACTTCSCANGRRSCQAYMCEWACAEPRHVPGECCPLCDHELNTVAAAGDAGVQATTCPSTNITCPLRCVHGFRRDDAGCLLCQCQAEQCTLECGAEGFASAGGRKLCACAVTAAAPMPADCPPLSTCRRHCPHGFKVNRAGCEICRCRACPALNCATSCAHGFAAERGCPTCRCRESPHAVAASTDPTPAVNAKDAGCMTPEGRLRAPGETWDDACGRCLCHAGAALCSACGNCADGNATYASGESWNRDPCTRCTCDSGTKTCTQQVCGAGGCTGCTGHSSPGALLQATYLLVITVLFCTSLCLALYVARRCCRRRRLVVNGAYRAPETPPPQYASADRRLPHLYRFVSPFDSADRPPDKLPASPEMERIK